MDKLVRISVMRCCRSPRRPPDAVASRIYKQLSMRVFAWLLIQIANEIDCAIAGLTNDAIASEVIEAKSIERARDQTPQDSIKPSLIELKAKSATDKPSTEKPPTGWKVVTKDRLPGARKGCHYQIWESP